VSNEIVVSVTGGTPPGPPHNLQVSITGAAVTLTWSAPVTGGSPAEYVVEAGTAAGLANVGRATTRAPSLTVPGVPVGIYYVRVRARNVAGTSAPTADVVVDVR
jgi:hypothetical protein